MIIIIIGISKNAVFVVVFSEGKNKTILPINVLSDMWTDSQCCAFPNSGYDYQFIGP